MKSIYNILRPVSVNPHMNCSSKQARRKLRFGIVGAGAVAQSYMQAFECCEEAEVVGVADIRVELARQMAVSLRCRSYQDYEQMVRECVLDAVIVSTPPATHPDICIRILSSKIHVLCEKPLSISLDSARIMMDTARKSNVTLMMASKFRYVEDVVRARQIVRSGALGDLILCENVFASRVDMTSRWNSIPEISGGGVLIDNGTHSIDLMRYFLGPLEMVHVLEGKRSQGLRVEETVVVFVRSANGVIGSIDLSWVISKKRDSYLDIYGSRGTLSIGWKESKHTDYVRGESVIFGGGYNKLLAFRKQLDNFARAIRGEESALITDADALASVSVVETAYKALRQDQWVAVGEPWSSREANIFEVARGASA